MKRTHEQRVTDFLAAETWFDDPRLAAIYREIATGVEQNVTDPLASEQIRVVIQLARVHHDALVELAKAIDELEKKTQGDS
ncbi:MAG: hypothetical protein HY827_02785 [Actinobacteria bacterium]|nr:hypothetical protein [Actinomycetota bacterium]